MKRSSMQQPNNCCNGNNGHVSNNNSAGKNNSTAIWCAAITGSFGLVTSLILLFAKSKKKNEHEDKKTQNRMKVDDHKAEVEIRKHEIINKQDLELYRAKKEIDQEYKCISKRTIDQSNQFTLREWHETFNSKCPMPDYSAISHVNAILNICAGDFKPAMLMNLVSMYGALCFTEVRAKFLDGRLQTPSLQVIIEGEQGSGKSCFNDIFKTMFSRVIASDAKKTQERRCGEHHSSDRH